MDLGRLKSARLAAALTQAELAEAAGVRRATVGDLESGKQAARPGTVRKLAAALGVAPAVLTGGHAANTTAADVAALPHVSWGVGPLPARQSAADQHPLGTGREGQS